MSLLLQKSSVLSGIVLSISGSKSESNRLLILKQLYPNIDIVNLSSSDDTNFLIEALTFRICGYPSCRNCNAIFNGFICDFKI